MHTEYIQSTLYALYSLCENNREGKPGTVRRALDLCRHTITKNRQIQLQQKNSVDHDCVEIETLCVYSGYSTIQVTSYPLGPQLSKQQRHRDKGKVVQLTAQRNVCGIGEKPCIPMHVMWGS